MQRSEAPLVLFDAENMFYAAAWVNQGLSNAAGEPTGATYGFLRSMLSRGVTHGGLSDVVVCWGDRRSNLLRRKVYAAYKGNRDEVEVPFAMKQAGSQIPTLRTLLAASGIAQASCEGYEADDVMAVLARQARGEVVIYSSDHDLRQLVSPRVMVVSLGNNKQWTEAAVMEEYGVTPELLPYVFALSGDKGDNLPNVQGIGPKTASAVVVNNGPGPSWKFPLKGVSARHSAAIEAALPQIKLNVKLIRLGGCEPVPVHAPPDVGYVVSELERLEIRTILPADLICIRA